MKTAGIKAYNVHRDCFEAEDQAGEFCFPCCHCKHKTKKETEEPCNRCDHNTNAIPEEEDEI